MVKYPYQQNNDVLQVPVKKWEALLKGWTSRCEMYVLIRHCETGRVYRFFAANGTVKIPDSCEEFFTEDARPYSIMQRWSPDHG